MKPPRPGALSVRAYARHRGCSHTAVQQRIDAGSLPTSAKRIKGRWWILDPEKADAEWEATTRPWVKVDGQAGPEPGPSPELEGLDLGPVARATVRERTARARVMEFEVAKKTREYVPAREVELLWSSLVVAARTALLGVPSRAKGRLPHLTVSDMLVIEDLIREALVDLSDGSAEESNVQAS